MPKSTPELKNILGRSKFLIAILFAFLTGIFLGDIIRVDYGWLAGILLGVLTGIILFWSRNYWRLAFLAFFGFFLGLGYFNWQDLANRSIILPLGKEIILTGEIVGHPEISADNIQYVLSLGKGKIQLTAPRYPEYHYGDKLKVKGILKEPPSYLFHRKIQAALYYGKIEKVGQGGNKVIRIIYQLRDRFEENLNLALKEPYASFAAGLLLGSRRNIPDSLMSDFNRTGTTHIIAVSGYNVTIIIFYIGLVLGLFSRRIGFYGTILVILIFVIMTGAPASVVRAGILAGLVSWGKFEGRRINQLILILLVASLMLLLNPYMLKFDVGFELSFLAFAGLVYLSPILTNLKFINILPDLVRTSLSETLGAQIAVLPILIVVFGRASIISPLTNILVLWLIPTAMFGVFLVGMAGFLSAGFAGIVSWSAWLFLKYIIIVVEFFSKFPWASLEVKLQSWWWLPIFYVLLGLAIYKSRRANEKSSF